MNHGTASTRLFVYLKRAAQEVPGAHRLYKWVTSRTGEGRVYDIRNGPLAGARWRRYNALPYWYHTGLYEPDLSGTIANQLRPGDAFWDVGAHAGYHTLIGARTVGPRGRVLAVEPDPSICAIMRQQLALNDAENVTVVEAAVVGDDRPTITLMVRDDDTRGTALAELRNSAIENARGRPIEVTATTLELLASSHFAPNVMKMDVEGAEEAIIPAAEAFFTGPKAPRTVILAYHGSAVGSTCAERMRRYGYRLGSGAGFATDTSRTYGTLLWFR